MVTTVTPQHPILQRYVDIFYLFRSERSERSDHIAFPHVNTGLSFFRSVSIERNDHRISIKELSGGKPEIEILGKYTKPVFVSCEGIIDEVAIVFKPLGVNRFIREDLIRVAPGYTQPYSNDRWLKAAEELFCSDNRVDFLENFLISVLSEKEEFISIEQALSMLDTNDFDYSIADVADNLNINLKTFQRTFKKIMACSPSDYKRIARFRNALTSKLLSGEIKSLTSITYEQNYTDQSYFIREFRKLTNQNPRHFFKQVSLVDGDKIIWEIL